MHLIIPNIHHLSGNGCIGPGKKHSECKVSVGPPVTALTTRYILCPPPTSALSHSHEHLNMQIGIWRLVSCHQVAWSGGVGRESGFSLCPPFFPTHCVRKVATLLLWEQLLWITVAFGGSSLLSSD